MIGPMINVQQLGNVERVIAEAKASGAKLLVGGENSWTNYSTTCFC